MKGTWGWLELSGGLAALAGVAVWWGGARWTPEPPDWLMPVFFLLATVLLLLALGEKRRFVRILVGEGKAARAKMEQQYADHTEALEQLRLSSHKELERFRSDLAHGLRMPIAIVQGYAELLQGDLISDPAVQKEYLGKIMQRTRYMSEALSRQFSAQDVMEGAALNYQRIDLIKLVRQAVDDMQTAAARQGVVIQIVSAQDNIEIEADVYQLNRVFFNLIENAIKYMGRDGVITIRITQQGEQVSIMVKDDGLGLPSEEVEKIFDLEYQGSNHSGGSGHGLYLVRDAVVAHGGAISAESAPGRGMGIFITLPASLSGHLVGSVAT